MSSSVDHAQDASRRPHRDRLYVPPTRRGALKGRPQTHAADGPILGLRDHGAALPRRKPQLVESTRQLPVEFSAEEVRQ